MVFATVLLCPNTTGELPSSVLSKLKCKISEGFYEIKTKNHIDQLHLYDSVTLNEQKALT